MAIRGQRSSGIDELSGGTQQKVLVARALASQADLVLLDDPFRGVDVATKHDTYGLIHEEADRGRAFVWFSTETLSSRNVTGSTSYEGAASRPS